MINDERALSRATDPDKGLSDKRPSSPIDEAKAMDHAEKTGQLPAPVERSMKPGADVKTGEGDNEAHHSMKGINDEDHPGSQNRAKQEVDNKADEQRRGANPVGVIVDLRHSPDPAGDKAMMQSHADSVNQSLADDGHPPVPVSFIDP